jgi:hypothetical protein
LGRGAGDALIAAFVCVDGLGTAEMEFFSIVSRMRPELAVYVYGNERSAARIRRAIELGAKGDVNKAVIDALAAPLSGPASQPETSDTHSGAPRTSSSVTDSAPGGVIQDALPRDVPQDTPAVVRPDEDLEPTVAEPYGEEKSDDEAPGAPVRVPWLRYGDGPVRAAPQRVPPAAGPPGPSEPAAPRSPSIEPLLTDEELQALIGSDISTIVPGKRATTLEERGKEEKSP